MGRKGTTAKTQTAPSVACWQSGLRDGFEAAPVAARLAVRRLRHQTVPVPLFLLRTCPVRAFPAATRMHPRRALSAAGTAGQAQVGLTLPLPNVSCRRCNTNSEPCCLPSAIYAFARNRDPPHSPRPRNPKSPSLSFSLSLYSPIWGSPQCRPRKAPCNQHASATAVVASPSGLASPRSS